MQRQSFCQEEKRSGTRKHAVLAGLGANGPRCSLWWIFLRILHAIAPRGLLVAGRFEGSQLKEQRGESEFRFHLDRQTPLVIGEPDGDLCPASHWSGDGFGF